MTIDTYLTLDKYLTNVNNLEHPCFLSLSNKQAFESQIYTSQSLNRKLYKYPIFI